MTDAEIRLECLRLAIQLKDQNSLALAKEFYEFVIADRSSPAE